MTTVTIDISSLPDRLTEVLELAKNGTEVLVTDAAGPVVKLVPAAPPSPSTGKREWVFNLHPGAMVMRADFDDPVDEDAFLRGDI
ncbi:MAG TPA: hypothetical protein VH092_22830 [Urbifossiella sp.]|nr:hypothetical protein [Urbifossiella sp.]